MQRWEHAGAGRYYQTMVPLRRLTPDSADITVAAVRDLQAIYRPGHKFAKASVMLQDLQDAGIEAAPPISKMATCRESEA